MMKRVFIFFIASILCFTQSLVYAYNSDRKILDTYMLSGDIDGKYPIVMYLYIGDNTVSGRYYYKSQGKYIDLKGSLTRTGIILEEYVGRELTGEFVGTFNQNSIIFSGNWINPKTGKSMPFNLTRMNLHIYHIERYEVGYNSDYLNIEATYDKISTRNNAVVAAINNHIGFNTQEYIREYSGATGMLHLPANEFYHDSKLIYLDGNVVSFSYSGSWYTGGARHYKYMGVNMYNIHTGKKLNEDVADLIINFDDERLLSVMRQKIRPVWDDMQGMSFQGELGTVYSRDDFYNVRLNECSYYYLNSEKVVFVFYSEYYRETIELSFSIAEMKPFIKRNSPFWYLFN